MSRILSAVGALVLALAICFVGYFSVDNACNTLEAHLLNICHIARQEGTANAIKKADEAVKLWEGKHDLIESFIRHEETDKLEELIKSLPVYARQDNMERLEQQADLAIDELHHLMRSEKPIISNIF